MNDISDFFGKILIDDVRDRTIRNIDSIVTGRMKDEDSQCLYKKICLLSLKQNELINELIPKIVDFTLHNMLEMFEEHEEIELTVKGRNLNEISDGLAGELYTEDGWIQKYTKQRYEEM
ncbi:MAG: hypothetical protein IJR93_07295 [Treponema sp.]|nr:hypothetical protein [Treponema sp.]MBQ7166729.1 hypothetical protein [Treponema sp.]